MAPALMATLSNYWHSGKVKKLSFYFFLLSSRILFHGILPQFVYSFPNWRISGLFLMFDNYEYSCYRCLSSLGRSSVLCPINLGLGLAFPHLFCPSFLMYKPKYVLNPLQISTLYQFGILGPMGFLSLHQWLKAFVYERRLCVCKEGKPLSTCIPEEPRGSLSGQFPCSQAFR